jgi:hypothetical protein
LYGFIPLCSKRRLNSLLRKFPKKIIDSWNITGFEGVKVCCSHLARLPGSEEEKKLMGKGHLKALRKCVPLRFAQG